MDPATLALAALLWHGSIDIAVGPAERGPWQQNESRYRYVDDPSVAMDERGEIGLAWVDQARKDVLFRRADPKGQLLGEMVNVSRSPGTFSWLPRAAMRDKAVYLAWQEIIFSGGSHGGDILFARSEDAGKTFSQPINLSGSTAGDGKGRISKDLWHNGSLDVALGPNGGLYLAWTEYEGALWLRRSRDGGRTFTERLRIPDRKPARAPALAIGKQAIYLAWTVGDDRRADIRVAKSTDGAASFGAPVIVAPSRHYSDAPKLAVDSAGTLHLAYAEDDRILYTRSADGAKFERPRDVSGKGAGFPSLGVDGGGNVYVLWERYPDGETPRGLMLAVSRDGGGSFEATEVPRSADAGRNGSLQGMLMEKLAVGREGSLAVVNSSFQEGKRSRVWLTRGQLVPKK
jgi:hypothetical protein